MPATESAAAKSKPAAEPAPKPAAAPERVLLGAGNSSSPDVQFLASKRAHLVGALATGPSSSAVADEIEAIDAQLAELGYKAT